MGHRGYEQFWMGFTGAKIRDLRWSRQADQFEE